MKLDRDHPGFRDQNYRGRRDQIAQIALNYEDGQPVPNVEYIAEEHEVWRVVWNKLRPLHEQYACREFLESDADLGLSRTQVPQFDSINQQIQRRTGFRMTPVAGLVASQVFLSYLHRGIFLATQYMRHHSEPLYTPEPDVVHEFVGHAVTLAHPKVGVNQSCFWEGGDRCLCR